MNEVETAKLACIEAGKVAMKYFRGDFGYSFKGDRNIVTQADIEAEKRAKAVVLKDFPLHGFLGEEGGASGSSDHVWVIDPIDGTTNFFHGVGQFAVSVAYARRGELVCGCVYNPVSGSLYWAQAGKGAWLGKSRLRVSKVSRLRDALLISGFPYDEPSLEEKTFRSMASLRAECQDIRRFGSASLDLCYVAQGICDGFFEYRLQPWDVAAGMLIVREAGGRVTDINGAEATMDSGHFLASNGLLHAEMLGRTERV
ncbi:MAG: inositol monophosphatase [Candidatus Diapherotrites archaeon]|uniref:inositol-phosphate phosphatase n=1 Tax=Candidatus Iainarchaeum sp. TaxID=3101447 RepID=A0A8T3YKD4_9ARCH|nr:inositol monophosphatase [Candidatus Diapherotrites archaeon]